MNKGKRSQDKNISKIKVTSELLQSGQITTFAAIFTYSNRTYVAEQLGMNYKRLGQLAADPEPLRIREIKSIARLYKISPRIIANVIFNQVEQLPRTKK